MRGVLLIRFLLALSLPGLLSPARGAAQVTPPSVTTSPPVLSGIGSDPVSTTEVVLQWRTDVPTRTVLRWMPCDSNRQPFRPIDSLTDDVPSITHRVTIPRLTPATIHRCEITATTSTDAATATAWVIPRSTSSGTIDVYFNHSIDTSVSTGEIAHGNQSFEKLLIKRIAAATRSIDITLWGFDQLTDVVVALIDAQRRGVRIRFITTAAPDTPLVDSLRRHGIPVLKRTTDTSFSMHNKFWIFDHRGSTDPMSQFLWSGSTNVTHPQFHSDRNNVILIQDAGICAVHTMEFEEMWGSHTDTPDPANARFGRRKEDNTPHALVVGGRRIGVYFAPTDSVALEVGRVMSANATSRLAFCMLKFELPRIEDTLHALQNRGCRIMGVFDSTNVLLPGSAWPRMSGSGVPGAWAPPADVVIDTIHGLIHHKYCLIDVDDASGPPITITGSYNWETPADTANDENVLIIHDARITNLYRQEFSARWSESGGAPTGTDASPPPAIPSAAVMLHANHPNPFGGSTTITCTLGTATTIVLRIHDALGREVARPFEGPIAAGVHAFRWDAARLPAGVYCCTLETAGTRCTIPMIHRP